MSTINQYNPMTYSNELRLSCLRNQSDRYTRNCAEYIWRCMDHRVDIDKWTCHLGIGTTHSPDFLQYSHIIKHNKSQQFHRPIYQCSNEDFASVMQAPSILSRYQPSKSYNLNWNNLPATNDHFCSLSSFKRVVNSTDLSMYVSQGF